MFSALVHEPRGGSGNKVQGHRNPHGGWGKSWCLALALGIALAVASPGRALAEEDEGGGVLTAVLIGAVVGGVVGLIFFVAQDDPQQNQASQSSASNDTPGSVDPWLAPTPVATERAQVTPDAFRVRF